MENRSSYRVGEPDRTREHVRRVLAERETRREICDQRGTFFLKSANGRDGMDKDRGLAGIGTIERFFRSLEADFREIHPENRVCLFEHTAGGGVLCTQGASEYQ